MPAALSQSCLAVQRRVAGRRIATEFLGKSVLVARRGKRFAFG
jgi:hypothetical protein